MFSHILLNSKRISVQKQLKGAVSRIVNVIMRGCLGNRCRGESDSELTTATVMGADSSNLQAMPTIISL